MDSCTIIYLVKSELFDQFLTILQYPVVIDTSVYTEVVVEGKKKKYSDAFHAEKKMETFKIPIIPVDISEYLYIMRDPGETSCYILAKDDGICITTDGRAYRKFRNEKVKAVKLDTLLYEFFKNQQFSSEIFMQFINSLKKYNAINADTVLFYNQKILSEKKGDI